MLQVLRRELIFYYSGFDGTGFVKGVQLMSTNYANIMGKNASGQVTGIGNVLKV